MSAFFFNTQNLPKRIHKFVGIFLILSFITPHIYAQTPIEELPLCSRELRVAEVLPKDSPRLKHDGNLSQLHGYLSCVWWKNDQSLDSLMREVPFYNAECVQTYQCIPWKKKSPESFQSDLWDINIWAPGAFIGTEVQYLDIEKTCALNAMDLIMSRRENVIIGKNGAHYPSPLSNICEHKKADPTLILCPRFIGKARTAPNPCDPKNEYYYEALYEEMAAGSFEVKGMRPALP